MALTAAELWFRGQGGALLRFEIHDAAPIDLLGTAHGALVTIHGLGEHMGKYDEWAAHAAVRGFHVMLYDQRGHGRTPGRRGDYRFDDLVGDLARLVGVTADRYPDTPIFVVGHSLGGLVALRYAAREVHPAVRGLVLSAPPIALARTPPGWFRWMVWGLDRVAPWYPLRRRTAIHTRDPDRAAVFASDALGHRAITPRATVETAAAIEAVLADPGAVRLPLLALFGEADIVLRVAESAALFDRVGSDDVTVVRFPDALHEVLQEIDRRRVYDLVCDWCEQRAGR